MLERTHSKIAERTSREAARARLSAFQRYYDEAVFYQSQYTGLEPEANLRASRAAARRRPRAIRPERRHRAPGLRSPLPHFDLAEIGVITTRYYELALLLAEAISQPLPGENATAQARTHCRILDRVERVRSPTAVLHDRRAVYLEQMGDQVAAEAERGLANDDGQGRPFLGRRLPGGRRCLPLTRLHAGGPGIPAPPGPRARPFLGPIPAGDLPPQGASAVRGPGRADGMPEPAARLRLDVSP